MPQLNLNSRSKLIQFGFILLLTFHTLQLSHGIYDEEYEDDHVAKYKEDLPQSYLRRLQNGTIVYASALNNTISVIETLDTNSAIESAELNENKEPKVEVISDVIERAKDLLFADEIINEIPIPHAHLNTTIVNTNTTIVNTNTTISNTTDESSTLPLTNETLPTDDLDANVVGGTGIEDGGTEIEIETKEEIMEENTNNDNKKQQENSGKAGKTLTDIAEKHTQDAIESTSAAESTSQVSYNVFTVGALVCTIFLSIHNQL